MADPNFPGASTHFLLAPAAELPLGLPLDANPREPNINRPVYRAVGRSLRQQDESLPGSFHLKHRGISIVASAVHKVDSDRADGLDVYELHFPEDGTYGIVDGGHSYKLVREAIEAGAVPENSFIKLEVMTGLPADLITDIAGGRNTSMQVHAKSLLDLRNEFQFLKDILAPKGWADVIAWHEGDDGDVDVVDLVAVLSCFDIASFPDRNSHPVDAYRRKQSMLDRFQSDVDRYRRLGPIVNDVLYLHDWIAFDSQARWQEVGGTTGTVGRYKRLEMVESTDGKPEFHFPFLNGERSGLRLRRPALFPVLAAFRLLVVPDEDAEPIGKYQPVKWRDGFEGVLERWREAGGQLLRDFYEHWDSTGRDLHAAGRSPALWGSLYKELAVIDAEKRNLF